MWLRRAREGRTLILEGEGRCLIWREDADPCRRGRTLSKEDAVPVWQRKRCLGSRRTLSSPRVRTLSISGGKGCRSEGLLLDPVVGRIDLADLVLYIADLVLYVADLEV